MIFKYKGYKYKLGIQDFIKICRLNCKLKIKRTLRFVKRLCIYNISLFYVALILFIASIIIWQIGVFFSIDGSTSYLNVIWDLKGTIVASIVVVFFLNSISGEKKHKEILHNQMAVYNTCDSVFQTFFEKIFMLVTGTKFDHSIFLTEAHCDFYKHELSKFKNTNTVYIREKNRVLLGSYIANKLHLDISFEDFINLNIEKMNLDLQSVKASLDTEHIIATEYDIELANERINSFFFDLHLMKRAAVVRTEEFLDCIISLANTAFVIMPLLRRPWRWDFKIDNEIRNILYGNNINYDTTKVWKCD